MSRVECILCNAKLKKIIYHMENMPTLVQNLPTKEELNQDYGMDLDLYECEGCGLIQFSCAPVYYYKDVIRAVGLSATMKKLRQNQYEYFIDKYNLSNKKIWEVGCGGGEFLSIWSDYPVEAFGTENSSKLVNQALEEGLNVTQGYVTADYVDTNGPFDAFVSFNYFEHQPNPSDMVKGIYSNLSEGGIGLITVPSFEYFIEKASYYEFMRDHIAYYTEEALSNLFLLNGFQVLEISRFNGDTTQIIVQKRKRKVLPDFDAQKHAIEKQLEVIVAGYKDDIHKIAVWGASHQALTLLATLNVSFDFDYIIDSSPIKTGFYSPVSKLEIKNPTILNEDAPDLIIIMAPAFSKEITEQIQSTTDKVKYILAIKDDNVMIMQ